MSKSVVILLQPGAADWEYGPVLPILKEYFGARIRTASPDGKTIQTMGGVMIDADTGFDTADVGEADLVVIIGSDAWMRFHDDALSTRLRRRADEGRPLAAICAGTLALARAGVLNARPHTSNSGPFLSENAVEYSGGDQYRDVAHAVSDGVVATAPGSAPASFAVACAALLDPAKQAEVVGYWNMARGEFEDLGTELGPIWKA